METFLITNTWKRPEILNAWSGQRGDSNTFSFVHIENSQNNCMRTRFLWVSKSSEWDLNLHFVFHRILLYWDNMKWLENEQLKRASMLGQINYTLIFLVPVPSPKHEVTLHWHFLPEMSLFFSRIIKRKCFIALCLSIGKIRSVLG